VKDLDLLWSFDSGLWAVKLGIRRWSDSKILSTIGWPADSKVVAAWYF
jgi:hypothetical protein